MVVLQSLVLQRGLSETYDDKNSSSPNTSLLNGHMPLAANPDLIVLGVNACSSALPTSSAAS